MTLADAGLAADQDRDIVIDDFLDGLQKVPHRRRPRAEPVAETRITTSS